MCLDPLTRRAELSSFPSTVRAELVSEVLLPAMEDVGFIEPLGIALARTPSPPVHELPALTTLSDDFMRYMPEDCPACTRGKSTLIPIQHDSYQLKLAAFTHKTTITRAVAKPSTSVIERYKGVGAFQLHRTYTEEGRANTRHHAYFVDLAPVLTQSEFRSRLRAKTEPWRDKRIDLVLHPKHHVADRLAAMVAHELVRYSRAGLRPTRSPTDEPARPKLALWCAPDMFGRRCCHIWCESAGLSAGDYIVQRHYGLDEYELYCSWGAPDHRAREFSGVCLTSCIIRSQIRGLCVWSACIYRSGRKPSANGAQSYGS